MAIQPIDLQTMFTQMDKVGKNQAALREGLQIQESIQQAQSQKKLEENVQSVNQSQNMGDEAETIRDENRKGSGNSNSGSPDDKQGEGNEESEKDEKQNLIRDPALGRNIDISG